MGKQLGIGKTLAQMAATLAVFACVFLMNARFQSAAVQTVAEQETAVRLPVIMYHSILKDQARAGRYVLSPDALAADLDYLKAQGYETVSIAQLVDYVDGAGTLPEKPVLLTFDDGQYNNYLYAYPLLKERGMCAVVSVIGAETVRYTETGQENAYWSYLSAERLREMQESGVFEIENHSYDLHENAGRKGCLKRRGEDDAAYRALLIEDTERAQEMLVNAGLPAPLCYAYPYGACSRETEEVLRGLGFRCTLGCAEKENLITRDPDCLYLLGRYNRPSGVSTEAFFGKALA